MINFAPMQLIARLLFNKTTTMNMNRRPLLFILFIILASHTVFAQFENVSNDDRLGGKGTKQYSINAGYYKQFNSFRDRYSQIAKDSDGNPMLDEMGNAKKTGAFDTDPATWPCDSMYECWRRLYNRAPFYTKSIYVQGATMLDSMSLHAQKSDAERLMYFQDLMQIYEDRIRRCDSLNSIEKEERYKSKRSAVMAKAADVYYHTAPLVKGSGYTPEKAYINYVKAFEAVRNESDAGSDEIVPSYLVNYFLACRDLYITDSEKYLEQFLTDYITCLETCDKMKAAYININPEKWETYAWAYDKTKLEFQNSGAAEPKKLINYFSPRIENHSKDINYLNNVVFLMFYFGLINNDAFFDACEKAYFIKPGFENCIGMGQMSLTIDKDRIGAKKYFDEASDSAKNAKERYLAAFFTGEALRVTPSPTKGEEEDTKIYNKRVTDWWGVLKGACYYYEKAISNAPEAGVDEQTQAEIYWKIANTYSRAHEWEKARNNKNMILACYPNSPYNIRALSEQIEAGSQKDAEREAKELAKRQAYSKTMKAYNEAKAKQKAEDDFWVAGKK